MLMTFLMGVKMTSYRRLRSYNNKGNLFLNSVSVMVPKGLRSVFKTLCKFVFMTNCYEEYYAHILSVCIIQKI